MVNMVSKRPLDTPLHEVGIEAGTNSHYRVKADVSDRLDERGNLLYRLPATGLTADGQIHMTENERIAIAPADTWRSEDAERLTQRSEERSGGEEGVRQGRTRGWQYR